MVKNKKMLQIFMIAIALTTVIPLLIAIYLLKPDVLFKDSKMTATPVIITVTMLIASLGVFMLYRISSNVSALSKNATQIAQGKLTEEIKPVRESISEVSGIAESLNLITEQLILNVDELESRAILLERANAELKRIDNKKMNLFLMFHMSCGRR